MRHQFRWTHNPQLQCWEKGKLRVSDELIAQIDITKARSMRWKKRTSVLRLLQSLGVR